MAGETIVLNEQLVRKLETKIISLENENLKSKNSTDTKMVEKIKKLIEEEVECSLNR